MQEKSRMVEKRRRFGMGRARRNGWSRRRLRERRLRKTRRGRSFILETSTEKPSRFVTSIGYHQIMISKDKKRKKTKTSSYQPNLQERRANAEHDKIVPVLERALKTFQEKRMSIKDTQEFLEVWLDDEKSVVYLKPDDGKHICHEGEMDWIALESMKHLVRPKFQKLNQTPSSNLKGRIQGFHLV